MSCDYAIYDNNGNEVLADKELWKGKFTSGFSFDDASKRYCEKLVAVRKELANGTLVDDTETFINADWS